MDYCNQRRRAERESGLPICSSPDTWCDHGVAKPHCSRLKYAGDLGVN